MSQPCTTLGYAEARMPACRDVVEQKIIRAYVRLIFTPRAGKRLSDYYHHAYWRY